MGFDGEGFYGVGGNIFCKLCLWFIAESSFPFLRVRFYSSFLHSLHFVGGFDLFACGLQSLRAHLDVFPWCQCDAPMFVNQIVTL